MSSHNGPGGPANVDDGEMEEVEEVYGIVALKIVRDTIFRGLARHCNTIERVMSDGGDINSLVTHREQLSIEIEDLRRAHSDYTQALQEDGQPTPDSYSYINDKEWMVRNLFDRMDQSMQPKQSSSLEIVAVDRDNNPALPHSRERSADQRDSDSSSGTESSTSGYHRSKRSRYSPSMERKPYPRDWIDNRCSFAPSHSNSVNPMWMMNVIPQLKIEPFGGDPREWPNFISSFKDMIHDVLPTDSQRLAVLKQLLTSEVRSYISEYLDNASTYYDALAELRKRYGQPQVVARAHLTTLMNLPNIKEDDYAQLGTFSRTLHGAMHALSHGGYEQDLEAGMTLEHIIRKLPPRMRNNWGIKVYKMAPKRATLKNLAQWLDEMVMGEMMIRSCQGGSDKSVRFKERHDRETGKSRPLSSPRPTILMTDSQSNICLYCERSHKIANCNSFKDMNVENRAEWARDKKLCFRCLKGPHRSAECSSKVVCNIDSCGQRHHFLLHGAPRMFPQKSKDPEELPGPSLRMLQLQSKNPTVNTMSINYPIVTTLLNVVPVILEAKGKVVHTHALLDNGSDVSLIRSDIARRLGLKGANRIVTFGTFHGKDPAIETSNVNFTVKSLDESFVTKIAYASTIADLKLPKRSYNLKILKQRWPHLRDVHTKQVDFGDVTVLIGAEVQEAHLQLDVRRPPIGTTAPFGVLTPFGWCCVGPIPNEDNSSQSHMILTIHHQKDDCDLHKKVATFWETESFAITPNLPESEEDKRARAIVESTTTHNGTRFVVGLPWVSSTVSLANNYDAALRRLRSIEHRFRRDRVFAERYAAVINDYIQDGFARQLKASEIDGPEGKTWYLPHHGVVNPQKPGKVRVVFDASARHCGQSLNDVLLKGPNLLNDVVAVLLLFRERAVSLSGDIKQMFLQVKVQPEDQSALRFLWRQPGTFTPPTIYQMQVQIFGAISSPFICSNVLRVNAERHRKDFPVVADRIITNFYVDNLLDSFDSEEEAIKASRQYSDLLKKGGFHLNQWVSSSRKVLSIFPREDRSNPMLNIDLDDLPVERTLGVLYNSESDVFLFKIKLDSDAHTKRRILSVVATVYDPLGFLSPVILIAKKILQEIWASGSNWDEIVNEEILIQWQRWITHLPQLENIKIPRALTQCSRFQQAQVHAFCDASTIGFGAVVYIRLVYDKVVIKVSFVLSKSRVAPLRPLSIPRLELQGAVVALRLVKKVISSLRLKVDRIFYWSDSKTVLQWIKSKTCRFHTFVANRVAEILEDSNPDHWFHVPGADNPADECSRGLFPTDLDQTHRWFNGPAFLHSSEESWPNQIINNEPSSDDPEVNQSKWVGLINQSNKVDGLRQIVLKSSNLFRCCRIVAWVLRYINNLRLKASHDQIRTGFLTIPEINSARRLCIQFAQQDCFGTEIKALNSSKPIRNDSHIIKLTPFLDKHGLLRVGGRIDRGDFSYDVKHPILLPQDHAITNLIIMEEHLLLRHPSVERLLSSLRSRFWVIRGRATVKRYVNKCFTCKIRHRLPDFPLMASLPKSRIEPFLPPFTNTGIDYFGPYQVTIYRRKEKRYVLLFTCLVTRAVHLEWTATLDTNSFIMAFQRFSDRKGCPAVVYSDNGTQIVAGDKEIRECLDRWDKKKIDGAMSRRLIQWHYSPPAAPHFGGVWERLVKSAKIALQSIMDSRPLTDEMLLTILTEVESLLNGRPLTHISVDPRDPEPLTPNHFILGRANPNIPMDVFEDSELASRRTWRAAQVMVNHFWRRWLKEYLPSITERKKWRKQQPNLEVDDIVLVVNPDSPRGHWPIGRVIRIITSQDGVVRSAVVKTRTGEYLRPAAKLCLLEKDVF